jgi:dTDP-4-dehydrorhamnose reductase
MPFRIPWVPEEERPRILLTSRGNISDTLRTYFSHMNPTPTVTQIPGRFPDSYAWGVIDEFRPHLIINTLAATDVRAIELSDNEYDRAIMSNVVFVNNLVHKVDGLERCRLIHLSTDYVFGNLRREAYPEDPRNPINRYGETKAASEEIIEAECQIPWKILRLSGYYGPNGNNFARTIYRRRNDPAIEVNTNWTRLTSFDSLVKGLSYVVGSGWDRSLIHHVTDRYDEGVFYTWAEHAGFIVISAHGQARILHVPADRYVRRPNVVLAPTVPVRNTWRQRIRLFCALQDVRERIHDFQDPR